MSGKKGMKHYSREIKLEAVRMYLEEGLTRREIALKLGLRKPKRVSVWARQYRAEGEAAFSKPKGRPRKRPESLEEEVKRLRMENDLLKKFHAELRHQELAGRNIGSSTDSESDTL
jgi:transposase-like protein